MKKTTLALALAALFAPALHAQEASTKDTEVGKISIIGEGDKLGAGQILQEDSAKARSTVTRAALDKLRPTANPFQALTLLPGVNQYNHDATGLFGGGLRVRGFNSDQMGFTVDGAPVNDSGSFSVFPQEYSDIENTCEIFVTQGSADNDAPHVGATGGNIGIVTCDPMDRRHVKLSQTVGTDALRKTFVRLDTGKLPFANGWSSFLSYSNAKVDKFKGRGEADRDHVDFKTVLDLGGGSRLVATALWNKAINNNYRTGTKAQFDANPNFDFSDTFVGNPAPVAGTRQSPATQDTYYGLSLNPFQNAIFTAKANLQLTPGLRLDIEPYYWYGYGTGGTQQFTLNEGGTFRGGVEDINGDGDRLDSVIVYRSSVTDTHRPGATVKLTWQGGAHKVTGGLWYERARHQQTGPATRVDAGGSAVDLWLEGALVLHADGSPFQLRDTLTVSRAGSFFVSDSIGLLNDRLKVDVAVKRPWIDRSFQNFANDGTGANVDYATSKRWDEWLPSIGAKYQITDAHQVYGQVARNFKVPGNFVWFGAIVNGVNRVDQINEQLKAERSTNLDVGYRFFSKYVTLSSTLFAVSFKDRLSRQFLPELGVTLDTNVGDATLRGLEVELGTAPVAGFSVYASASYTKSRMKDDLRVSTTNLQPTSGKEFPDTPRWMTALALQYARGAFYAGLQGKYLGKRYSTLTNDEQVGGYTLFDLNAGYRFPSLGFLRNPTIRASIANLGDKRYLSLSSGSGSLFTTNATGTGASSPSYYLGAPRFTSVTLAGEF